ncbi:MAG: hypothetical protein F4065_04780 [Rhodothermaceae bacterium]|nr:hypothetical protein [Rhodothermaceae bacterium]MXZ59106.1 hypothetical protein [Rhodothermaceae bacterium]MYB90315.1 hypothetical protein [Rhodothermaceae bacterium]MYD68509.1 hypothetical protein [Rhodothermaceae bacterium]MYG45640.1 hypothetical protein [Rhodothermaceae bacterium]
MNIAFEIALVVLVVAVLFGGSHLLGKIDPNSFKSLLVSLAAAILMFILVLTEGIDHPAGWALLLFVTAAFMRKTILYYRAKAEPLENHEVA